MDRVIVNQPIGNTLDTDKVQQGLTVVTHLNDSNWKQFVDQQPEGNIFHTPEMFQVFAQTRGFRPTLWAVVCGNNQIEALFVPVQVTLNTLLRPLTTRAISYGSVLFSHSEDGRRALALLLKTYAEETGRTCLFTELRNVSSLENEQESLQEHGYAYEEHLNYLIDLGRPPEEIFLGIGARTRKSIKHALNRGHVTILEATKPEQIRTCYNLLSQTYRAARVPLADISLFEAAFDLLYPKGMVRFTLAYVGEAPAAVSVDLLYKDVIYGWYGGMDRAYSRYVPNELVMWHLLKWGSENGFSLYDFGGAGKPDEEYGVRDFKAKFGGRLVCYGRNIFVHSPAALWLSKQGYGVMRHLFKGRLLGL